MSKAKRTSKAQDTKAIRVLGEDLTIDLIKSGGHLGLVVRGTPERVAEYCAAHMPTDKFRHAETATDPSNPANVSALYEVLAA